MQVYFFHCTFSQGHKTNHFLELMDLANQYYALADIKVKANVFSCIYKDQKCYQGCPSKKKLAKVTEEIGEKTEPIFSFSLNYVCTPKTGFTPPFDFQGMFNYIVWDDGYFTLRGYIAERLVDTDLLKWANSCFQLLLNYRGSLPICFFSDVFELERFPSMLVSGIGVEDEYTKFEHAVVTSIGQNARFYHKLPFLFRVNYVGPSLLNEETNGQGKWICNFPQLPNEFERYHECPEWENMFNYLVKKQVLAFVTLEEEEDSD